MREVLNLVLTYGNGTIDALLRLDGLSTVGTRVVRARRLAAFIHASCQRSERKYNSRHNDRWCWK